MNNVQLALSSAIEILPWRNNQGFSSTLFEVASNNGFKKVSKSIETEMPSLKKSIFSKALSYFPFRIGKLNYISEWLSGDTKLPFLSVSISPKSDFQLHLFSETFSNVTFYIDLRVEYDMMLPLLLRKQIEHFVKSWMSKNFSID